ncbi:START domain-containing protein 10 isoform X2 [Bombina bombina]|uniref:START domain-containing protein 10 isoform X2 n=1 Tax=Bombina bombina TaxID=8345 RepID=UPI00235B23B3|nr:START domain-containing protein 10 isoform X2 [Bombina bombina]
MPVVEGPIRKTSVSFQSRLTLPDVSASTVFDVLHDLSYRKNWDLSMIETFDIARLSANVDVGYYAWKCPKPLRNRDVVTLRSWLILPDCYMIINYSVKHKMYPPRKDLVRAVSLQAGYLIEHTGLNSCSLTYTAKVDPRGSLPKWMVNKAAQYLAPKLMRSLYKACQRYPPWKLKNQPDYKPWLYMEQNTLPRMHLGELTLQRAESLEEVDESKASEVKEDSDEDN